jgi:hypothetical protein
LAPIVTQACASSCHRRAAETAAIFKNHSTLRS